MSSSAAGAGQALLHRLVAHLAVAGGRPPRAAAPWSRSSSAAARARRRPRVATWSKVEPAAPRRADAGAHGRDDPLGLLALEPSVVVSTEASIARESSWPASQRRQCAAAPGKQRGRRRRPLSRFETVARVRSCPRADPGSRSRWAWLRGGARRVLELLLGAEQRVQHLLAQALAQGEGERRRRRCRRGAARPRRRRFFFFAPAQRVGRLAQGSRGLAELALDLLVVQRPWSAPCRSIPPVGAASPTRRRCAGSSRSSSSSTSRCTYAFERTA